MTTRGVPPPHIAIRSTYARRIHAQSRARQLNYPPDILGPLHMAWNVTGQITCCWHCNLSPDRSLANFPASLSNELPSCRADVCSGAVSGLSAFGRGDAVNRHSSAHRAGCDGASMVCTMTASLPATATAARWKPGRSRSCSPHLRRSHSDRRAGEENRRGRRATRAVGCRHAGIYGRHSRSHRIGSAWSSVPLTNRSRAPEVGCGAQKIDRDHPFWARAKDVGDRSAYATSVATIICVSFGRVVAAIE